MNNTAQKIVAPAKIESELLRIWDTVSKDKMRACLFNLIVFNQLSERTDYIRTIVQKIINTFPCRVLFISHDHDPSKHYLKTAVSVISAQESTIACDHIDIGVAGSDWERVPSVILPHIIPDLPLILLWAEDPAKPHPLFASLSAWATRIIFDSESSDHLLAFSKELLILKEQKGKNVADLNWARLEGWRDCLATTFETKDRWPDLADIKEVTITYNARPTEFFCHLKIQSMYLLALLSSRLSWKITSSKKEDQQFRFFFDKNIEAKIVPAIWENLGPGAVISVEMKTSRETHYLFNRTQEQPHQAIIQISSLERCELPCQFIMGKTVTGQSLVHEIFLKGTSPFFLEMLHQLVLLDRDNLC